MARFRDMLIGLRRPGQSSEPPRLVRFPPFPRRHWIACSLVAILLAGLGYVGELIESQKCGPGLTMVGSPYVCVGLDLDSTAFRGADPLTDLENTTAANNRAISGPFVTIVALEDFTPDPRSDIVTLHKQRHSIEGAITAVSRANDLKTGATPMIKLLLANYSLDASFWPQTVDAIKRARMSEHIVAVIGIGQSLDTTRNAVASLSEAGIAVVGADATADNLNIAPGPGAQRSMDFFRVAPTNTEEAQAAAKYIEQHHYHKVLLVKDVNEADSYAQTLAKDFATDVKVDDTEPYRSPDKPLSLATRGQVMSEFFTNMHSDICAIRPDLIYFAGRGIDLGDFLTALSSSGACGLGLLDVMTGDDGLNLVDERLSTHGDLSFNVFYTADAHTDEWSSFPSTSDYVKNYQDFTTTFYQEHFKDANLDDGETMTNYDAALVAILAIQKDPLAITEPETVANFLVSIRCHNSVPGATGPIAFDSDGNPIDKAIPILQLHANGTVTQKDLFWPTGQPFDPTSTCH